MRLFLSSYRAGNYSNRLVEIFGKGVKVAVITNAKDYKSKEERKESVDEVINFFLELGLKSTEIDLRDYFSKTKNLERELRKYQAVWLAGGNTFILRRALSYSGADKILSDMARKNEVVLGGESAGACVVGPTLRGVEHGDDPDIAPAGYQSEIIWSGLNLVRYSLIPHYGAEAFADESLRMENYLKTSGLPYKTLTDTQALLLNGSKEEFLK
ncbi:Type 1 glutamine amidotransferase-like domain-containing protein [Candidatus Saccharibacteria bacterium]|nr:Type 1 glutamine amidotransferase-like domain-containing protein [Candidatus Saccharibacteria bacterium]